MRSRCLAWPGPAAAAATKGEGGPGREEPGCSWTRGAGGGMRREESPLECELGRLCLNKDLASPQPPAKRDAQLLQVGQRPARAFSVTPSSKQFFFLL